MFQHRKMTSNNNPIILAALLKLIENNFLFMVREKERRERYNRDLEIRTNNFVDRQIQLLDYSRQIMNSAISTENTSNNNGEN